MHLCTSTSHLILSVEEGYAVTQPLKRTCLKKGLVQGVAKGVSEALEIVGREYFMGCLKDAAWGNY